MPNIIWLDPHSHEFPSPELADDDGFLCAGGDLSPDRILAAYRQGIFPWFNPQDPILWWSPNPRTVVFPEQLHLSKSLRKLLRKATYTVTFDRCFSDVMRACAAPRTYADGTWISPDIIAGYSALHERGAAHSVEVWQAEELVGGLYGIVLGQVFFGESMFSRADNASKFGFAHLVKQLIQWEIKIIDCQVANDHLFCLGAIEIPRQVFRQYLLDFTHAPSHYPRHWEGVILEQWSE
jgi:leucyl/phenylalanyl-tRNA---protein transferase